MKKTASRDSSKKSAPNGATSAPATQASSGSTSSSAGTSAAAGTSATASAASASSSALSSAGTITSAGAISSAGTITSAGSATTPGSAPEDGAGKHSATTDAADRIIAAGDLLAIAAHAENLTSEKPTTATASARILDDLLLKKPDLLVAAVERFVATIASPNKRAVQTSAAALPVIAKLAPARVARHLPQLTEAFAEASDVGRDGLVTTFAALCTASVAYQKRLEPVLEVALSTAEPKTLQRWTEVVLPSLKGEPHARARAVVEVRLPTLPRPLAQPIATFLGIKLRPLGR